MSQRIAENPVARNASGPHPVESDEPMNAEAVWDRWMDQVPQAQIPTDGPDGSPAHHVPLGRWERPM